ncbi:hypothetical protein M527_29110 [Sphingobium indicum IP26]|uniref:helix-turn-helix transcriptional regulator n=1 Tax=Sphingobium sp. HDIP04 TaxID=428994 RepID=UPI0003810802|nr:AlpA family phage regulatory protein [Sphingobium sp. HDIP04]EPR14176.1 hypothetical protein M527_29110 [Sphingobium indicum IP26]
MVKSIVDPAEPKPLVKDRRSDSLVRIATVRQRTGLSQSTIYRREADGTFPKRIRLGHNCVAWYLSDIEDFIEAPADYRAE